MKKIISFLLITISFYLFTNVVSANEATYEALGKYYFKVDKSDCEITQVDDKEIYRCKINGHEAKFHKTGAKYVDWIIDNMLAGALGEKHKIYLYTGKDDPVLLDESKWWESLYACRETKTYFGLVPSFDDNALDFAIYTNSMISDIDANKDSFWDVLSGDSSKCYTYNVKDVDKDNLVNYCDIYSDAYAGVNDAVIKYISSSKSEKAKYKGEYTNSLLKLRNRCNIIMQSADITDPCVFSCLSLPNSVKNWEREMDLYNNGGCGFSDTLLAWIKNIISIIKYIIPVIVIIFGIVDFIKAIASDKDDEMKKAQGRFIKRLIAAALVFIVPFIIEFILDKAGFINDDCAVDLLGKIGL